MKIGLIILADYFIMINNNPLRYYACLINIDIINIKLIDRSYLHEIYLLKMGY
jgi:hypothetical protein